MDKIGEVFECARLRWSTSKEADSSKFKKGEDRVQEVSEWSGSKPFSSIAGRVIVVEEDSVIKRFMFPRHWHDSRFVAIDLLRIFNEPFKTVKDFLLFFSAFSPYL